MNPNMIEYTLTVVSIIALAIAIYSGTGGRGWFGTREKSHKLVGRKVRFDRIEYLEKDASLPTGTVKEFNYPHYRIILDIPFDYANKSERFVDVAAHFKGWPVSGAIKRPTHVLAILESGTKFWADLKAI